MFVSELGWKGHSGGPHFQFLAIWRIFVVQAICGDPLKCPTPYAVWNGILQSVVREEVKCSKLYGR